MTSDDGFTLKNGDISINTGRPVITQGVYEALIENSRFARAIAGLTADSPAAKLPAENLDHILLALHHRAQHDDASALGKLADWCRDTREQKSLSYNWTVELSAELSAEDRWCWWPAGELQNVDGALACGLWAPHTRTHPDGEVVAMCDEHTAEFDRLIAERDRALQAAGVVVVRPVQEETHED